MSDSTTSLSLELPVPLITPHADAPIFSAPDANKVLGQILGEISSGNFPVNDVFRSLIRQASLVNLYFFLKCVASYSGPYNDLTPSLHLSMCNFRQGLVEEGVKLGMFVPRSTYKSGCVGEKVWSSKGLINIEDIRREDILFQLNTEGKIQTCKVKAVEHDISSCVELTLSTGSKIRVADYHGVMTPDGWKTAIELSVGEGIKLATHVWPTKEGTLEDWCQGVIWGDGGLTQNDVKLTSADLEIIELFNTLHPVKFISKYGYRVIKGNKWWNTTGLPRCLAIHKDYPFEKEGNAAFLRGLFDTDGFFQKQGSGPGFCSASEKLAKGVQRNLLHFGILSTLVETKTSSLNGKAFYILCYGRESLLNFSKYIGFTHKKKAQKLAKAIAQDKGHGRIYETIPTQIWKKWIHSGEHTRKLKDKIRIDNNYWMTFKKARKLGNILNKSIEVEKEISSSHRWIFIREIRQIGVQPIVHVEIEGDPQYIDGCNLIAHNSTICTHGGSAWDMIRNPDIRIGVFSSIYDRAHDFFVQTQRIFDSNELFAWVFPEYVPSGADGNRWNDKEGVLPNRTRIFPEPNIKPFAAGGSTQGIHVDEGLFDDIVGDSQLNADHGSTADMYRIKNWFKSSLRTLLISMKKSRVMLSATRYGIDDPYEDVMLNACEQIGFWDEIGSNYPLNPEGEWKVYYRMAIENGKSIFPESYTVESLQKLAESDPWTYQTQYLNNPVGSNNIEFAGYEIPTFDLEYDSHLGWYIDIPNEESRIKLSECDLVCAIDPAGVERFVSMKTSRSVVCVLARSLDDRYFLVDVKAGYVPTTTWFDWMFDNMEQYPTIRGTFIEQQAGFKALTSLIRAEEARRQKWIHHIPVNALGDKAVTIRNILQPILERGVLYINKKHYTMVAEELRTFPSGTKRDILDALKIAVKMSIRPDSFEEDREVYTVQRNLQAIGRNKSTGY